MTDWINQFMDATSSVNSPEIFRRWGAIFALSAAMERKTWVHTMGSALYPNLYVIFVAPPGVGKTEITWRVQDTVSSLADHFISPSSLTKASLIDTLADAKRTVALPLPEEPLKFNSLPIIANELGVLLPSYDFEFMNVLTDLFDCKTYEERRRTRDLKIKIDKPQLSLLAACTPAYLTSMLPEGAWDQGFLSRTILVFCSQVEMREIFVDFDGRDTLKTAKKDLQKRADVVGKFEFTQEAKDALTNWYKLGGPPAPEHPKLLHYNTRRLVHLLKLTMVASMSEDTELVIEQRHVLRALDWLVEAEAVMPHIFKAMNSGGATQVIEEVWYYVYQEYNKGGQKGVSEFLLTRYLSSKVPPYQVPQIIDLMKKGGLLQERLGKGGTEYVPLGKV